MPQWIFDETNQQLGVTGHHVTDPELWRVINHVITVWDQRTTIYGNAYGPAEMVRNDGYVEHATDNLYRELMQNARGRIVIEHSIKWYWSEHSIYIPVNAHSEPNLRDFREVIADVQTIAESVHPYSTFAVRIRALTIPAILATRPFPYDTQSRFRRTLRRVTEQLVRGEWSPPDPPIQARHSEWPLPEYGSNITPETIRAALARVDNSPVPEIDDEPIESEHAAVRHRPGDGPYPLDFGAVISQIDELTDDQSSSD
jgi:hypothetical protein